MDIILGPGVTVARERVLSSGAFSHWAASHGTDGEGVITIIDVDEWKGNIGTIYMSVAVPDEPWAVKHILRSPTVDVLTTVTDGSDAGWAVFVRQYRRAVGQQVISNIAGDRGWEEEPVTAALREFLEELGLEDMFTLDVSLPQHLTGDLRVAHNGSEIHASVRIEKLCPKEALASPGAINEAVSMFKATVTVSPAQLEAFLDHLEGKQTGVAEEGEKITVIFYPIAHLRRGFFYTSDTENYVDGKLLASFGLAGYLQ